MPLHVGKYYLLQTDLFIYLTTMLAFIYLQCNTLLFGRMEFFFFFIGSTPASLLCVLFLLCCTVSLVKYALAQRSKMVHNVYNVLEGNADTCSCKPLKQV